MPTYYGFYCHPVALKRYLVTGTTLGVLAVLDFKLVVFLAASAVQRRQVSMAPRHAVFTHGSLGNLSYNAPYLHLRPRNEF